MPSKACSVPYEPRLSPKSNSFGRVAAGMVASARLHRSDHLATGVGRLVGVDEERDPTRQERVLERDERGVAVVHVLEGICGLGVDPAGARRREDRDDIARPRVGAVELRDREVDSLRERVGRVETDVHADRLLGRRPLNSEISFRVGPEPMKSRPFVRRACPTARASRAAAAFGLGRLHDPGLGAVVDDRVRGVQRVQRGVEQETLDAADDKNDREHDAHGHRHHTRREPVDEPDGDAGEPADDARDHEQQHRNQHRDDEDRAPLPRGLRIHAHQVADVFLPRSAEYEEQRHEQHARAEEDPPRDALELAPGLRSDDVADTRRQRAAQAVADHGGDATDNPCTATVRGSNDGVNDRQKNTSAPASPPKHRRRRNTQRKRSRTGRRRRAGAAGAPLDPLCDKRVRRGFGDDAHRSRGGTSRVAYFPAHRSSVLPASRRAHRGGARALQHGRTTVTFR